MFVGITRIVQLARPHPRRRARPVSKIEAADPQTKDRRKPRRRPPGDAAKGRRIDLDA